MSRSETRPSVDDVVPYETRLSQDRRWALSEASRFFQGEGGVQETLRAVTKRLNDLGVPYAVAGGIALFQHGYRRFTEDIDILVTRDGLRMIHDTIEGLGYVRPFAGSKNLKDTQHGVRIEFLIAGDYPGDGKPKPVAFPNPDQVAVEFDGIKYLNLPTLIELKLASGMSNPRRGKDLIDVEALIDQLRLPETFAEQLNPYVREEYRNRWRIVNAPRDDAPQP